MHKNKKAGKVIPCKKYMGENEDSKPGFKYGGTQEVDAWEWPCFTYDPMNETSKKAAMKAAIKSGQEYIDKLEKKVRQEIADEEFKTTVKEKSGTKK